MRIRQCLKEVGIVMLIALVSMPVAVVVTIFSFPFWSWFEKAGGIESMGHSGPASWCYLLVYFLIIAGVVVLRLRGRRRDIE